MSTPADAHTKTKWSPPLANLRNTLALPPKWLAMYDDFVTKNASQVSQLESALRSLTYIIPGTDRPYDLYISPPFAPRAHAPFRRSLPRRRTRNRIHPLISATPLALP